jgi:hypothetical protein
MLNSHPRKEVPPRLFAVVHRVSDAGATDERLTTHEGGEQKETWALVTGRRTGHGRTLARNADAAHAHFAERARTNLKVPFSGFLTTVSMPVAVVVDVAGHSTPSNVNSADS